MSLNPTKKEPYRLSVGYGFWVDDWANDFITRLNIAKREYVDISDMGTARMSKNMAENFLVYLKNALASGTIPLADRKDTYKYAYHKKMGWQTGEMYSGLSAFRTNIGGEKKHRGWIVGIKEKEISSREYPLWFRLSWFEYGTKHQEARPIVARAFEAYVGEGRVKMTVEKMLARGATNTKARSNFYSGKGGDE
jgi:hypothetical protein